MSILLSLLLAQARVLPEIDRRALELQARAEAVQNRRPTTPRPATARPTTAANNTTTRRNTAANVATSQRITRPVTPTRTTTQPTRQASATRTATPSPVRPASIRRTAGGTLDLSAITTICRSAGNQADPATFLTTLSRAYQLDSNESQSLRTSCAAYLAGRADARVNNYGAPAH